MAMFMVMVFGQLAIELSSSKYIAKFCSNLPNYPSVSGKKVLWYSFQDESGVVESETGGEKLCQYNFK